MGLFMKCSLNYVKNPRLFKMLERSLMYNFKVQYRSANRMAVGDWGSISLCAEGQHEDFLTLNTEMGITVKSLRVKLLDLLDPKLEDLATMGASWQHSQRP